MIYVPLRGRLGNNLFQIATAANLSDEFTLCITHPSQIPYVESYKNTFFKDTLIINNVPEGITHYQEPYFHYNNIPYKNQEDIILDGYFQSFKYFNTKDTQKRFAINEETNKLLQERYGTILSGETTSINVRRGDYLKQSHRHPFCGKKFYLDAINILGKNKTYIVSSDDIKWCKKIFKGKNFHFVENSTPMIDLYIQTVCTNNIISNSSFSWWGAYLNPNPTKKVIVPFRWFGMDCHDLDIKDLFPPEFIIIKNSYEPVIYIKALYLYYRKKMGQLFPVYYTIKNRIKKITGIRNKTMYD